jgi:hypothetical protein
MNKYIKEDVDKEDVFNKNIEKLTKDTLRVDMMPKGFKSVPNEFKKLHVDAHLVLKRHLKRKFGLKGDRQRPELLFNTRGERRHIRLSNIYSQKKIVRKSAVAALAKSPSLRPAYFMKYKSKYFPYDLEDMTIAAIDIVQNNGLIGPCIVVDLSDSTREDFGNILGRTKDMERVFTFLQVPKADEIKEPEEIEPTDTDLTDKQLDLFNNPPNEDSVDIGFKDSLETNSSIKRLDKLKDSAHKIRAAQLMLNRLDGTLARAKDPDKIKNLEKSKRMWTSYKKSLSKEF